MISVEEFARRVFSRLGLDWRKHVRLDPRYFRPSEVDALQGDASRARRELGWEPRHDIDSLIADMVTSDMRLAERDRVLRDAGHSEARRAS
jgi:GDPmannose 4,6-dehydratase